MKPEHEIIAKVYAAKENSEAADQLVSQYLPFIRTQTAKFLKRIPAQNDDALAIAMFAFHEAAVAYEERRGAFLPFAARVIKNRLIDFSRREQRHHHVVSLDQQDAEQNKQPLIERLDLGKDETTEHTERAATKEEIIKFSKELTTYGLTLEEVADNCPKQQRTRKACHLTLAFAKEHTELLEILTETRRLPLSQLSTGAGVERKTLERHRKYMVAILLAYTNGFELIRNHLRQIEPVQGGREK